MSSNLVPAEFGDVVLVRFPFTNQTAFKQRPAVVVSNRTYNSARPDLVIMAITSQLRASAGVGDVWIVEWQIAGLLKPSAVKPVVLKSLGRLQVVDVSKLRESITAILG